MPNDTNKVQNLRDSRCMTRPPGRNFPNHNACYKVNACYTVIEADQLYYCSCCIRIRIVVLLQQLPETALSTSVCYELEGVEGRAIYFSKYM